MTTLEQKENKLYQIISQYRQVLVAYSGGLDSALALWAAVKTLGPDRVWAVTSNSDSLPKDEEAEARRIAREIGLPEERHRIITTNEMSDPDYTENPLNRCYFCKKELFGTLQKLAEELKVEAIFDGSNMSDTGDFRPGRKAAEEFEIVSPLLEAELTKDELRQIARKYTSVFCG